MCFRFLSLFAAACLARAGTPGILRVCADPDNLPFSNERGEGFENRLAELMARQLGMKLEYTWWSQRKSFVKNSLAQGRCDTLMGVPAALDSVTVTRPYYRSTYVFVSRASLNPPLVSLDDPRLAKWRIGIHVVGDDYAPPAVALARRGLSANIAGYSLFGKFGEQNPPARLIDAVAAGEVDVAIVWGPFAGFFSRRERIPLKTMPVSPPMFLAVPFTYEISMGVRKGDAALQSKLDRALERNCVAVRAILDEYAVPQLVMEPERSACESERPPLSSSR